MPLWWDRLFNPDKIYGASDPRARFAALADQLDSLDPWELPTVVAGRQLIADTVAMLPMVAHDGVRRLDPTPSLLRRPDPGEPYRRTQERTVNALTRHGMAWLDVTRVGSNGWPLSVQLIPNRLVTWQLDPTGTRIAGVWIDGQPVQPANRVRWIPMLSDPGPIGVSPLQRINTALEQLVAVFRFSSEYYGSGAVPPYAVIHPNRLTATQAGEHMDAWLTARAERRPALLSGGVQLETYQPQSAADALLLDAVNYLDSTVARVLQIPPSLLNTVAQSSLTYSTTLDERQRWLQLGLYPGYLTRIQAAYSDLLPHGQVALFDTSELLRMDQRQRIDAYAQSIAAGIHTVPEVRALEGLPADPAAQPKPILPNVEGL